MMRGYGDGGDGRPVHVRHSEDLVGKNCTVAKGMNHSTKMMRMWAHLQIRLMSICTGIC